MRSVVVAIDGPAGAGKSTVAKAVASRTGLSLVDTGAIYRAVALKARWEGVLWDDEERCAEIARALPISFRLEGEKNRVFLGEGEAAKEVTAAIRASEIGMGASRVSKLPKVRAALLDLQRRLGERGAVLEGRDIGTVVFPDAPVKIFLTATPAERARRRALELADRGQAEPYEKVLSEIVARDKQDSEREVAPLRPAEDALLLDSTSLTLPEVVSRIVERVEEVRGKRG